MDLLRHLRYFRAVAEELHFGRAAERLGMAQPPLSQRIRGLEEELGARLFDRSSRGVRLTAAGEVLLAESEELLAAAERTRKRVSLAASGAYGTLRVGVPPELPGRVLAEILTAFAAEVPDVRLDLQEIGTAGQLRLLAERALDTGLVQRPADLAGLTSGPAVSLPLGVVVPRDSPLADTVASGGFGATGDLPLQELAGHPLVIFPRDAAPGLYDATLAACRARGYRPPSVVHAGSPEVVLGLVIAGRGIALAHAAVARKEPRVVWRPLAPDALRWDMSFVWPADAPHPAAPRLAEVAAAVLGTEDPTGPRAAAMPAAETPAEPSAAAAPSRPWDVVYAPPGEAV
ncbi:LysR substrate-binding domain-containing protein [Streptomyces sp. XD-27]|uniref:LysR substrate-binding domain-containing protein n=1 Tax=Streptomyces sp. XD-27 TaxID=3062779 RepID=UPI0026F42108|nr:LysR substrate-binding domain-containing protein [Streptomyces sp. XD-27]WKX69954.1 LysR substrate-binding domain-containing protein [Streptomyces sp. XD-27]